MNNERTAALLATLEACANERLDELVRARARVAALQEQNRRLEARSRELERHSHELERHRHELEQQHHDLALKHQALGEKCRELEEKFARAPHTADGHAHPRSQGLSALLSHRARPVAAPPRPAPIRPASPDAGALASAMPSAAEPEASEPASASQPDEGASQATRPIGEAPSPQALLNQWYHRYPDAFFKGHTRPLRVGIHEDLLAREPWPEKLVRRALACYVHLPRYLKAVREQAERVGLDGEAAGPVTEGEARYARKKLDELRAQQQAERATKAGPEDKKSGNKGGHKDGNQSRKQASRRSGEPGRRHDLPAGRQEERQEERPQGAGPRQAPTAQSPAAQATAAAPTPQAPAAAPAAQAPAAAPTSPEAPAERMERKLGALLAKHSSR